MTVDRRRAVELLWTSTSVLLRLAVSFALSASTWTTTDLSLLSGMSRPSVRTSLPSVRLSVCPSIYLSVSLSICLFVSLSVCPSICLSVCLLLFVVVAELAIITDLERMLELFGFQAASKNVQ